MGIFGKSRHEKEVEGLFRLTTHLYSMLGGDKIVTEARALRFERPDSHFRLLFLCLSTAQCAAASKMKNPDAILNDSMLTLVQFSLTPEGRIFTPPPDPQEAANLAGACVQDFLNRWSSWVDISPSNPATATAIVVGMLREVESAAPIAKGDGDRLFPLGQWVERSLEPMRSAF